MLSSLRMVEAARYPAADTAVAGGAVLAMATGTLCAAITGFLCIRYFLRYLQTKSFFPFIIYRWILAIVVLIYYTRYQF
jgi:undecaprenyl-diphosphatase